MKNQKAEIQQVATYPAGSGLKTALLRLGSSAILLAFAVIVARAEVPNLINYQGKVLVGGTPFNGTGQFKFALVGDVVAATRPAQATAVLSPGNQINSVMMTDLGLGYVTPPAVSFVPTAGGDGATAHAVVSGGRVTAIVVDNPGFGYFAAPTVQIAPPPLPTPVMATLWSNDGTGMGGSEPVAGVALPVTNGLYAVLLGDTNVAAMAALSPPVFAHSNVHLRVWFDDGVAGFQHLAPDQRVAAAAYALMAGSVPAQSLTAAQIAGAQVVKSLNGLKDQVTLQGGTNVTLTTNGNTLVIHAGNGTTPVLSGLPAGSTFAVTLDGLPAKLASPYRLYRPTTREGGSYEYKSYIRPQANLEISRPRTADQTWRDLFSQGVMSGGVRSLAMTLLTPNGGSVSWTGVVVLLEYRLALDGGTMTEMLGLWPQEPLSMRVLTRTVAQSAPVSAPSGPLADAQVFAGGTQWSNVIVLPGARVRFSANELVGNLGLLASAGFTLRASPLSVPATYDLLMIGSPITSSRVRAGGADMFQSSNVLCERYTLRLADDGLPIEEYELVFDPDF